jgi:hypothetical protein
MNVMDGSLHVAANMPHKLGNIFHLSQVLNGTYNLYEVLMTGGVYLYHKSRSVIGRDGDKLHKVDSELIEETLP